MSLKIDYDYDNYMYQYVPYSHLEDAIKPRYELTSNINKLGKNSFLFRDKEIAFAPYTIYDNRKNNESDVFSLIYLNTYNDIVNFNNPGLEERCFVLYNKDTEKFLKPVEERLLKEKVPFKVEKDFFNNYKEVFPLYDANKRLTINQEEQRNFKRIPFIKKADLSKYNFIPGNNYNNLYQLININIRCQANCQPFKPTQFLSENMIKELVTYVRKNPDKLWKAWTENSKRIEIERKQNRTIYKEQQQINNNNTFKNVLQEVRKKWRTR